MTRSELIDAFEKLLAAAERAADDMRYTTGIDDWQWAGINHAVVVAREQLGNARIRSRRTAERDAIELDREISGLDRARLTTPDPQVYNDISPG